MWRKVCSYILIVLAFSLFLSAIFWKLFGKDFNISWNPLNIEFFNTLCGFITIIGLVIAIFQIAELKTREEIEKQAVVESMKELFKKQTIGELAILKAELQSIIESISRRSKISKTSIEQYIFSFFEIEIKISNITSNQLNLTGNQIIDCSNLVNLHNRILQQLQTISTEQNFKNFPKQSLISEIGGFIKEVTLCEKKLTI